MREMEIVREDFLMGIVIEKEKRYRNNKRRNKMSKIEINIGSKYVRVC
jgi:hypothetical protein